MNIEKIIKMMFKKQEVQRVRPAKAAMLPPAKRPGLFLIFQRYFLSFQSIFFQRHFLDLSKVFSWSFKGIILVFQGYYLDLSKVFH